MGGAGPRILVVDDDATNRFIAVTILRQAGYETVEAQNGREAVESYERDSPALILMDLSMPLLSGIDAAREIRARAEAQGGEMPPVIALTGNVTDEHRAACIAAGFRGFATKPIDIDRLLTLVADALGR